MVRYAKYRTRRFYSVAGGRYYRLDRRVAGTLMAGMLLVGFVVFTGGMRHQPLAEVTGWAGEIAGQIAREGGRLGPVMGSWLSVNSERGKSILQQTLPAPAGDSLESPPLLSWHGRLRSWLYMALDYDIAQPQTMLAAMLPQPVQADMVVRVPQTGSPKDAVPASHQETPMQPKAAPSMSGAGDQQSMSTAAALAAVRHANTPELARLQQADWGNQPLVLILHTHTSEMYHYNAQGPQEAHRFNTTDTGILRVGEVLAQTLSERYGIPVVHSKAIHDFPNHAHAYTNAAKTIRQLLQKYPSIRVVIDVHRDASAQNVSFVREINGVQASQVMVVVSKLGATKPDLHPNWQDNMRFASKLEQTMQQLYPGLLRPYPPVTTARYNQNLSRNMVLLEVGAYADQEMYAIRSAAMVADALAVMVDWSGKNQVRPVAQTTPQKPAQAANSASRRGASVAPAANLPMPQQRRP